MAFEKGNKYGKGRPPLEFKLRCSLITDMVVVDAWEREVKEQGPDWVKCSELLANHGKGKPKESVELTGKNGGPIESVSATLDLGNLTTEKLEQLDAILAEAEKPAKP